MRFTTVAIVLVSFYVSIVVSKGLHSAVISLSDTYGCQRPSYKACIKCSYGQPKHVKLVVKNQLREPFMDNTIELCTRRIFLLGMMEEAATENKTFRFSATYYGEQLGYFIDAFDSVYGNYTLDKSYWEILDSNLKPTPVGASNYRPTDGETVTFNLTTGGHSA